jgi:putative ABC transport system permease protein
MEWLVRKMFRDNFNLAYKNIKERMSRSILTLLGIAIGIMAIISLMGIGEGMNVAVEGELSSLSDTIIVNVGEGFSIFSFGQLDNNGEYLTERDITDLERISGVKEVNTQLTGIASISFNGDDNNVMVTVTGMDVETMNLRYGLDDLYEGSLLQMGDQSKILIGYDVAHDYFDNDIHIGSRVKINGKKFFVNGIFSKQGMGGVSTNDDLVLLTSRDFQKATGESNIYSATVTVYNVNEVENIALEIEHAINENHGDDDFASATSMSSILDSIQSIMGILQTVLIAIASIALVVASIGIMNTMLTSVMERTREIGIMKAIGATNKDIMSIFIIEGLLLSLVGGASGIILGIFGSQGVSAILSNMGPGGGGTPLEPVITIMAIALALSVSMVVGILSSLYPAWKAARMSPIEAVRYE